MIRLWAKTITDEKIQKQLIYTSDEAYDSDLFFEHLVQICYKLDIPTPIMLKTHIYNFENFNNMRFSLGDFVEKINFDKLVIENALD